MPLLLLLGGCVPDGHAPLPTAAAAGSTSPQPGERIERTATPGSGEISPRTGPPALPSGILVGTGTLVRQPEPVQAKASTDEQGDVTLSFANADVREVMRAVLGDILHLNYVVDPRLQAAITVQTGRPLAREDVLPMLEGVLRANGAALVRSDDIWRILPIDEAPKGSVLSPGAARSGEPGFGVQILPLKYVSAAELKKTLDPFVPPGGVLEADASRNILILSGTRGDRENFVELTRVFDVDWLKGMSFGLFPLKIGTARQIADELGDILGQNGETPLAGVVRIVPIERLNAILVISPQGSYLREVRGWIDRLDYGEDETTPRLFQYYVQNSRAADLAAVLDELLAGEGRGPRPQVAPGQAITEIGPGGRQGARQGGASGTSSQGTPGQGITGSAITGSGTLGPGTTGPGTTGPGTTGAPGAAPLSGGPSGTATGMTGAGGGSARRPGSRQGEAERLLQGVNGGVARPPGAEMELPQVRVVADEKNNALVIFARPRDYRMIEGLIRKLDIVPLQVVIEATIAEVTLNDNLQYGLQFFLKNGAARFELNNANRGNGTLADITPVFPGFNYATVTKSASAILSLLSSVTDVNVVSSPQILVLDHQTAVIQVGDQVPIATQSAVSVLTPGAPIVNTLQYRDTGVILQVTPRVNSTGLVTLDIDQEVSDVAKTTSSTIDSPTISQRRIISTVIAQDGETLALGGLIRDGRNDSRSGIPVLSDLPLVGPLFRTTTKTRSRTELIVLLSPRVVRSAEDARKVTDELRQRMQTLKPLDYRIRGRR